MRLPRSIILNIIFLNFLDVVVGLWIIHPLRTTLSISKALVTSAETDSTYYFQAKSLSKQSGGNTTAIPQNTGLVQSLPLTPVHSVEKLSLGAISA